MLLQVRAQNFTKIVILEATWNRFIRYRSTKSLTK